MGCGHIRTVEILGQSGLKQSSGTKIRNPGLSRRFRDSWQLCIYTSALYTSFKHILLTLVSISFSVVDSDLELGLVVEGLVVELEISISSSSVLCSNIIHAYSTLYGHVH